MSRAYNFSAGPAVLPLEVLQDAQKDLVDYKGCGMSVMEMSHRGKDYDAIHQEAIATFKELCGLGDDWAVCFIQGGASMQFAMIPMNFLPKGGAADYAKQGTWSNKALKEGQKVAALRGATVNVSCDCAKDIPTRMPKPRRYGQRLLRLREGHPDPHAQGRRVEVGRRFRLLSPLLERDDRRR